MNSETVPSRRSMEDWLKIAGTIIAVATFVLSAAQYFANVNNEFRKTFWFEQLSLYKQACSSAAIIAITENIDSARAARNTFWTLYWGPLSMIEHKEVKDAMVEYGDTLYLVESGTLDPRFLKLPSYRLARACRQSLSKTWSPVDIGDLTDQK